MSKQTKWGTRKEGIQCPLEKGRSLCGSGMPRHRQFGLKLVIAFKRTLLELFRWPGKSCYRQDFNHLALRRPLAPAARPDDLVESRLRKRDITYRKRDIRGAGGRLVFQEKNLEPLPLQEFFYKTLSYKYEDLRKYVPSGPSKGASRHLGRQLRIHPYAWELSIHPGPDSRAL